MSKVLYISYDGMTDPLGQSQVIAYLIGLSKFGYEFHILSFEKIEKLEENKSDIGNLLKKNNIQWFPQTFHKNPPIISKLYDKLIIKYKAKKLHEQHQYSLIHCRSYLAAEVGLYLKRKTGVKFLFDMRGFWADEKADGGAWNRKNWFWNSVYLFYKKKEKQFIEESDFIISLTHKAKKEIGKWPFYNRKTPIEVIPCCADMKHFSLIDDIKKRNARRKLNISESRFVLSYLGSLGAWYMLEEMLDFFLCLLKIEKDAIFLILTNNDLQDVMEKVLSKGISQRNFVVMNVLYKEVPYYMYASDLSISFIKPVYSKMSSSPVKIGEILSMGIPLVMSDIGDANRIHDNGGALMVEEFTNKAYMNAIKSFFKDYKKDSIFLRSLASDFYSLESGVNDYNLVYTTCLQTIT